MSRRTNDNMTSGTKAVAGLLQERKRESTNKGN